MLFGIMGIFILFVKLNYIQKYVDKNNVAYRYQVIKYEMIFRRFNVLMGFK